MELFEKVSKDIVAAMKAKDKVTLEALRNIKKVFIEAKTVRCACSVWMRTLSACRAHVAAF